MTGTRYTQIPRPTLWLVQEGVARLGGDDPSAQPRTELHVASFYIGKSLVTNAQYEAFDPRHERCDVSSGDDHPVVNVSLREAEGYCAWYASLSKKAFRLPTEIEWEHACRAGRATRWPWGDDPSRSGEHAWLADNSGGLAHDVETLKPNAFGVHDLIGLAWEWVASSSSASAAGAGTRGMLRGGSFRTRVDDIAPGTRRLEEASARFDDAGFRIVRAL